MGGSVAFWGYSNFLSTSYPLISSRSASLFRINPITPFLPHPPSFPRTRTSPSLPFSSHAPLSSPPSHKAFRIKIKLAKKMKQNRPIPYWIRLRTDNKIRYNAKRRHWRRTKLGF
ncbi:unnamed protein product [Closterium sp. Naga37s-1]|nr:unnamed protein product [Closterium sp. Naga37s-1]